VHTEERMRRLNAVALGVALTYGLIAIKFVVAQKTVGSHGTTKEGVIVSPVVDFLFIVVTSAGLYRAIVSVMFRAVASSKTLLRLYWGDMYVDGLWSYTYTIDGSDGSGEFFGIWRFKQTLYGTFVVGYGLTNDYQIRSRVRSLTELVDYNHQLEVVNARFDSVDPGGEYYSRTTMYFESERRFLLRMPVRMAGKTFVYGGPLSGKICSNTFVRHPDVDTERALIERLKAERLGVNPGAGTAVRAPQAG
jgi:hypothetical protein